MRGAPGALGPYALNRLVSVGAAFLSDFCRSSCYRRVDVGLQQLYVGSSRSFGCAVKGGARTVYDPGCVKTEEAAFCAQH